jgi:hypothetical protein
VAALLLEPRSDVLFPSQLTRKVLNLAAAAIAPGVTTDELDAIVHQETLKRDAYPSPLNYRLFPKSVCTSVNEVICHGIPDARPLEEGDIVNLDVSLFYKGFHGDCNATFPVGKVDKESLDLIETTRKATRDAIAICKPGLPFAEIGNVIESVVKPKGYGIVTRYTGHGINQLVRRTCPRIRFRLCSLTDETHLSRPVPLRTQQCVPCFSTHVPCDDSRLTASNALFPALVLHYGKSKMPGIMREGNIFTIGALASHLEPY